MHTITPERLTEVLPAVCARDTSSDLQGWSAENPLWGHCAVVSLIAQNLFGGDLLRVSLKDVPAFAHMRSHYFNQLPDGSPLDFTAPQFRGQYEACQAVAETRERSYLLSDKETKRRYKLLAWRAMTRLAPEARPLAHDSNYARCFFTALDSPCNKMKFGCVIRQENRGMVNSCNETIPALKGFCCERCVRLDIPSRTEQMLGSCSHAEEAALWKSVYAGMNLKKCDLYVAGFYTSGLPWMKDKPEHTCLRCAVQMHHADVRAIFVPVRGVWHKISTQRALETALAYATGKKTL